MPSSAVYLTVTQTATGLQFPYAPCGPQLSAQRAAHPLAAPGRVNMPLPGVCETQCPGCGMLTSGPRAGWTPATYDAEGELTPVAFNPLLTPRSAPCARCAWVGADIGRHPKLDYLGLRPTVLTYLRAYLLALKESPDETARSRRPVRQRNHRAA